MTRAAVELLPGPAPSPERTRLSRMVHPAGFGRDCSPETGKYYQINPVHLLRLRWNPMAAVGLGLLDRG